MLFHTKVSHETRLAQLRELKATLISDLKEAKAQNESAIAELAARSAQLTALHAEAQTL